MKIHIMYRGTAKRDGGIGSGSYRAALGKLPDCGWVFHTLRNMI